MLDSLPSQARVGKLEKYYNGEVRLDALGVNIPPEVRVLEMVAPYPRMATDVLAEVLTFVGYTLGEGVEDERLAFLKRGFQINNMDSLIRQVITEALVQGAGYFIVGPGPDGVPRITAHQYRDVAVHTDHLGTVKEALVRIPSHGQNGAPDRYAYYTPGMVATYERTLTGRETWTKTTRLPYDVVPVVPLANRGRLGDRTGRSEMLDVLTLSDAASRTLTGLQVAQELEALPKRWIFADGVAQALAEAGKTKLEAYMGYLNFGPTGGSVQQLNGAALDPLINSYKLYAQIISAVTGIPPSMMGITTDNPSSADAMRVARDRLTSRGEAKQAIFGDALEDLARVVLRVAGMSVDGLEVLEAVWRDVATPSKTAQQAMAYQAFQAGAISARTMRDFLDLTPAQREREDARELAAEGMGKVITGDSFYDGSDGRGGPESASPEAAADDASNAGG